MSLDDLTAFYRSAMAEERVAYAELTGGRWITIGGDRNSERADDEEGEGGGSPVYIKGGTIVAGGGPLKGEKIQDVVDGSADASIEAKEKKKKGWHGKGNPYANTKKSDYEKKAKDSVDALLSQMGHSDEEIAASKSGAISDEDLAILNDKGSSVPQKNNILEKVEKELGLGHLGLTASELVKHGVDRDAAIDMVHDGFVKPGEINMGGDGQESAQPKFGDIQEQMEVLLDPSSSLGEMGSAISRMKEMGHDADMTFLSQRGVDVGVLEELHEMGLVEKGQGAWSTLPEFGGGGESPHGDKPPSFKGLEEASDKPDLSPKAQSLVSEILSDTDHSDKWDTALMHLESELGKTVTSDDLIDLGVDADAVDEMISGGFVADGTPEDDGSPATIAEAEAAGLSNEEIADGIANGTITAGDGKDKIPLSLEGTGPDDVKKPADTDEFGFQNLTDEQSAASQMIQDMHEDTDPEQIDNLFKAGLTTEEAEAYMANLHGEPTPEETALANSPEVEAKLDKFVNDMMSAQAAKSKAESEASKKALAHAVETVGYSYGPALKAKLETIAKHVGKAAKDLTTQDLLKAGVAPYYAKEMESDGKVKPTAQAAPEGGFVHKQQGSLAELGIKPTYGVSAVDALKGYEGEFTFQSRLRPFALATNDPNLLSLAADPSKGAALEAAVNEFIKASNDSDKGGYIDSVGKKEIIGRLKVSGQIHKQNQQLAKKKPKEHKAWREAQMSRAGDAGSLAKFNNMGATDPLRKGRDAVTIFTGSEYRDMRKAQQGAVSMKDYGHYKKLTDAAEAYLAKAPTRPGTVYRGLTTNRAMLDSILGGDIVSLGGLTSTSRNFSTAEGFDGGKGEQAGVIHEIEQVSGVDVKPISKHAGEDETMLSGNARFIKVGKVTKDKQGRFRVKLREIAR